MKFTESTLGALVLSSRPITYGIVQPGPDVSPDGIPLIRGKDYSSGKVDSSNLYHVLPEIDRPYSRSKVQGGDLLLSIVGYVGQVAKVPAELSGANITQTTARISVDTAKAESTFLFYYLSAPGFRSEITRFEKGSAQPGLNLSDVGRLRVRYPSLKEQCRIAEILSALDETIEQTDALIWKYQQIKAGLMHDLFTRGVKPDGKLRPTRAEAPQLYKQSSIGWIPQEWQIEKLGSLADIVSGVTLGSETERKSGIEVPYLRVANVQDGYLDLSEIKTIWVSREQFEKLCLKRGDVLMNEGGDYDKLGRGTVWNAEITPCIHQNHVFRVRSRSSQLQSNYLAYWSQSEFGKKYFVVSSKQSTNLASINSTQLKRFPVALPHSEEQQEIAIRLEATNANCASLNDQLEKLQQQKHGIMHDLLTERVRVKVAEE